jgi:hypothetical protein
MKLVIVGVVCAILAALASGVIVYKDTRKKWHDLGVNAGTIHGKLELMEEMCKFAVAGKVPNKVDYRLVAKDAELSIVRSGEGVILYCR